MKETIISEKLKRLMSSPEGKYIWDTFKLAPLPLCPDNYEKKAGAKGDLCFMIPGETCLIIENKCNGADLTERQKQFYLNHFMNFYSVHGLEFKKHILIFLCDQKNSKYFESLKEKFTKTYIPPEITEETKLENFYLNLAQEHEHGIDYHFENVIYRRPAPARSLVIDVRLNALNFDKIRGI